MDSPIPSIQNLIDQTSLRWIFVGGKGGVGKTTCSCCIATELSKYRERVLLISTDPAHNLSDAFDQKFSKLPTLVKGFPNLYAMEIDPTLNVEELEEDIVGADEAARSADFRRTITQVMTSFPGVDEYMSYTEVFRLVRNMDYSVVIFDTAPTGHTLRLLAFPELMENGLGKLVSLKNSIAPMLNQVMSFVGAGSSLMSEDITQALESRLPVVKEITRQFKDPQQTTFVCVCIAEFLSMYETERLVQALSVQEIDIHNIIVNQLLFPNILTLQTPDDGDSDGCQPVSDCRMCLARHKIQSKYLEQILELYDDMHVIQLPQLEEEVRGVEKIRSFSKFLLQPYVRPAST